jgi:hypothetical protein
MRTLETDLLRLVDGEHVLVLGVEAPQVPACCVTSSSKAICQPMG